MQRIKFRTAHKNVHIARVLVSHLLECADGPILLPQRRLGEAFLSILWLVRRCYEEVKPVLTSVNIPYVCAIHFGVLRPRHRLLLGSE